jgi:hypothetical protein
MLAAHIVAHVPDGEVAMLVPPSRINLAVHVKNMRRLGTAACGLN